MQAIQNVGLNFPAEFFKSVYEAVRNVLIKPVEFSGHFAATHNPTLPIA